MRRRGLQKVIYKEGEIVEGIFIFDEIHKGYFHEFIVPVADHIVRAIVEDYETGEIKAKNIYEIEFKDWTEDCKI